MKNFSGKVAVITGAGSGIGRALAVQLAERGCILSISDVSADGLQETRKLIEAAGAVCSTHIVDVADRAAVEEFAADVVREHGAVHLLVNNAGVTLVDWAEHVSYDDLEWIMNINFWGVVYGTKSFLPYMREVDEAHIVNVSSLFGLVSMPLQSAYNASKFAVRGFTEALKMELAGSHIGVSCVHPGGIKTGIGRNSRVSEEALSVSKEELIAEFEKAARTTPEKAAAVIIRGIEKNKRRVLIGGDARFVDLVARFLPGSYEKILGIEKKVLAAAKEKAASSS
jgi:NAD(P)-dependent dehydrogenase (short-subunit alcohol dehydrogenase family)